MTKKQFDIIIHTVKNIRQKGGQFEIFLKLKQSDSNQLFDFLNHESELFNCYHHVKSLTNESFWAGLDEIQNIVTSKSVEDLVAKGDIGISEIIIKKESNEIERADSENDSDDESGELEILTEETAPDVGLSTAIIATEKSPIPVENALSMFGNYYSSSDDEDDEEFSVDHSALVVVDEVLVDSEDLVVVKDVLSNIILEIVANEEGKKRVTLKDKDEEDEIIVEEEEDDDATASTASLSDDRDISYELNNDGDSQGNIDEKVILDEVNTGNISTANNVYDSEIATISNDSSKEDYSGDDECGISIINNIDVCNDATNVIEVEMERKSTVMDDILHKVTIIDENVLEGVKENLESNNGEIVPSEDGEVFMRTEEGIEDEIEMIQNVEGIPKDKNGVEDEDEDEDLRKINHEEKEEKNKKETEKNCVEKEGEEEEDADADEWGGEEEDEEELRSKRRMKWEMKEKGGGEIIEAVGFMGMEDVIEIEKECITDGDSGMREVEVMKEIIGLKEEGKEGEVREEVGEIEDFDGGDDNDAKFDEKVEEGEIEKEIEEVGSAEDEIKVEALNVEIQIEGMKEVKEEAEEGEVIEMNNGIEVEGEEEHVGLEGLGCPEVEGVLDDLISKVVLRDMIGKREQRMESSEATDEAVEADDLDEMIASTVENERNRDVKSSCSLEYVKAELGERQLELGENKAEKKIRKRQKNSFFSKGIEAVSAEGDACITEANSAIDGKTLLEHQNKRKEMTFTAEDLFSVPDKPISLPPIPIALSLAISIEAELAFIKELEADVERLGNENIDLLGIGLEYDDSLEEDVDEFVFWGKAHLIKRQCQERQKEIAEEQGRISLQLVETRKEITDKEDKEVIRKIELEKEIKRRDIELTKQKKQAERLKRVKLLQQELAEKAKLENIELQKKKDKDTALLNKSNSLVVTSEKGGVKVSTFKNSVKRIMEEGSKGGGDESSSSSDSESRRKKRKMERAKDSSSDTEDKELKRKKEKEKERGKHRDRSDMKSEKEDRYNGRDTDKNRDRSRRKRSRSREHRDDVDRESRSKHHSRDRRSESRGKSSKHNKNISNNKDHSSPSRKDKEASKKRRRSPSPRVTSSKLESAVSGNTSAPDTSTNNDLKEKIRLALGGSPAIVIAKKVEPQPLSMQDRIKLALSK